MKTLIFNLKKNFNTFFAKREETPMINTNTLDTAIVRLNNGRYGLYIDGELIHAYTRARDARRGQARRAAEVA